MFPFRDGDREVNGDSNSSGSKVSGSREGILDKNVNVDLKDDGRIQVRVFRCFPQPQIISLKVQASLLVSKDIMEVTTVFEKCFYVLYDSKDVLRRCIREVKYGK